VLILDRRTIKLSQEIRFGPQGEGRALLALFYTYEHTPIAALLSETLSRGAGGRSILNSRFFERRHQYAGFSTLTFNINDRFKPGWVDAKANSWRYTAINTGPGHFYLDPNVSANRSYGHSQAEAKNRGFHLSVAPELKVSPD